VTTLRFLLARVCEVQQQAKSCPRAFELVDGVGFVKVPDIRTTAAKGGAIQLVGISDDLFPIAGFPVDPHADETVFGAMSAGIPHLIQFVQGGIVHAEPAVTVGPLEPY
tara:strand:- start:287 stop:613 length:327 start_codon:yes stop_codon:yes gene_type:complete